MLADFGTQLAVFIGLSIGEDRFGAVRIGSRIGSSAIGDSDFHNQAMR